LINFKSGLAILNIAFKASVATLEVSILAELLKQLSFLIILSLDRFVQARGSLNR
jgi:hypothetical protein